jgi:hypothetical protein
LGNGKNRRLFCLTWQEVASRARVTAMFGKIGKVVFIRLSSRFVTVAGMY